MAYQVIARKYRPQRFRDVVGQEHVTDTLSHAIEQNRIAHAYLFCGPRGTGKTTIARIFAKCLNATGGPKVDFADDDPRAREIAEGRSIDVLEIDGASNRGIEEIRELRETVKYAPASSKFKIYIIDEVHMLTKEAFNALLKTLEEPPGHVMFMFATTEPDKVLPTILSRCQRYDLRRIPVKLIVKHLDEIARQEQVTIDPAALQAVARGAEGCMRDAESALDQLISFCGDRIGEDDVLSMFGLAAQAQILSLAAGVLQGEAETVLREVDALTRHGKDLSRLLGDLLSHFRNLLVFQVARGDVSLLEITETEHATLTEQAKLTGIESLTRIMEVLTEAETRMRDAASKKIFLEVALLKAIGARNAVSIDTILQHLQQLRGDGGDASTPQAAVNPAISKPAPAPAPPPAKASVPKPAPSPLSAAPAPVAGSSPTAQAAPLPASPPVPAAPTVSLDELWQQILEGVARASAMTRSWLVEAKPISLDKNVFTIGFDPEFRDHFDLANNSRTHALLQTKLQELGQPKVQIKFILTEAAAPKLSAASSEPKPLAAIRPVETPAPKPAAAEPVRREKVEPKTMREEDFKEDPLIKKALEIFKGQIVEIRA